MKQSIHPIHEYNFIIAATVCVFGIRSRVEKSRPLENNMHKHIQAPQIANNNKFHYLQLHEFYWIKSELIAV